MNWSASLRTQHYVREIWAKQFGLPHFLSKEFNESLDAVCDRMGVSTDAVVHSVGNAKLIEGSKALGYHVDTIPVSQPPPSLSGSPVTDSLLSFHSKTRTDQLILAVSALSDVRLCVHTVFLLIFP